MKKLLSILGSITLVASSASAVLACSDQSKTNNSNINKFQSLTDESVDSLKASILSDQYGMDLKKTKDAIDVSSDTETPDFNEPDSSVMSGMNLNGTLGKDNAPLYALGDQINSLLAKVGVKKPVDFTTIINQWGSVIKEIPYLIDTGNISQLIGLIPTVIKNVTQFIPSLNIDPDTITWIGTWVKDNIKYILSAFDFNSRIGEIVKNFANDKSKDKDEQSPTVEYVFKKGVQSLLDLGNLFFGPYKDASKDFNADYDVPTSVFLGQEIFTPLFNGKDFNKDAISKIFSTSMLLSNIKRIVDDAGNFIAALLFRINIYAPMMADSPKDVDNLFDPDKTIGDTSNKVGDSSTDNVFKKFDAMTVAYDENSGNITVDPSATKMSGNISLNSTIFGTINLLADDKPEDLSIFKLTNILFRSTTESNYLLSKLTYLLVDALKFTDYHVLVPEIIKSLPAGIGDVKISLDFELKDLFKPGKIEAVSGFGTTAIGILWPYTPIVNRNVNLNIILRMQGNGILGNVGYVVPLLEDVLDGKTITADGLKKLILPILGKGTGKEDSDDKGGDSFVVAMEETWEHNEGSVFSPDWESHEEWRDVQTNAGTLIDVAWGVYGSKISAILDGILNTLWYWPDNGDKFINALKASGFVKDEQAEGIRKSMSEFEPLSETVLHAMQNINIGGLKIDLTAISKYINLDSVLKILDIVFLKNTIQDKSASNTTQFDFPDSDGSKSLLEQILISLNYKPDIQSKEWTYYLGYVDETRSAKWDPNAEFVYRDGLIGNILGILYPNLDKANDQIPGVLQDADDSGFGKEINLRLLGHVQSDVMDALSAGMTKLGNDLQGDNITDIVDPLIDNDKVWKVSNIRNSYFNDTDQLKYESYDLTFDTTGMTITHTDKTGKTIVLPEKKVTYRVWFSRIDNNSTFSFKKIERIS